MSLPVIWTPNAQSEYADLLNEIEATYGLEVVLKFLDKAEKVVDTIEAYPNSFPLFDIEPTTRKAVITKQTSLIYQVFETETYLLYFWDNRRGGE